MAADWIISQGDTEPIFSDQLELSNGEKVNLEGATVKLVMRALTANRPATLTGTVSVASGKEGKVAFRPSAADSATVGNYMAQWVVTFSGGDQMTFPTEGYLWVQVQENLSTEGGAQIVGLPEIKAHLNLKESDHTHDAMIVEEIEAAQVLIEDRTGPILPQRYDELFDGGQNIITLLHTPSYGYGTSPVLNLIGVAEFRGPIEYNLSQVANPVFGSIYSYELNPRLGELTRRTAGGGVIGFMPGRNSVHVAYEAGQSKVPGNVKRAVVETIRWWRSTTEMTGKGSLAQADAEVVRPMVALPYHCIAMLEPTRRHPSLA